MSDFQSAYAAQIAALAQNQSMYVTAIGSVATQAYGSPYSNSTIRIEQNNWASLPDPFANTTPPKPKKQLLLLCKN